MIQHRRRWIDRPERSIPRSVCAWAGIMVLMVSLSACDAVVPIDPTGNLLDGNQNTFVTSPKGKTFGEPNGAFPQAIVAVFDAGGSARLQGNVSTLGDLDVFELGGLNPGDRVTVDVDTAGSALDVSVALFDDEQRLVFENDDRGGSGSRFLDSHVDWIVRHEGDPYYLVVTHSAFAAAERNTGNYRATARITGPQAVPQPMEQVVLLDFDGGVVDSPILGPLMLAPFNAASISPVYDGETQVVKDVILATFIQNFDRFNVTIRTTDDPPPNGTMVSTIFFGGFDPGAFGISEGVDLYNADICDDAIVFTESFELQFFSLIPTAEQMGIAIGNVGSHEAGHLLGLNHVDDDLALMDDASAADAFLDNQEFMESPLSSDIMPIGVQDAVLLLSETVGLRATGLAKR